MAMEGNPTFTQPISEGGGPAAPGKFVYGRDGPLGSKDHPYISGLAFVHQRTDNEDLPIDDYFLVVVESKRVWEGTATAIPRDLFTGESDEFWVFDSESRQYAQVYGPRSEAGARILDA